MRERSTYLEFRPPRALSRRLVCLWVRQIDREGGEHLQPVLPDGCMDIVWIGSAAPVVAGPATSRVMVALPTGATIVGVRFQPGWAARALGVPASDLLDRHVPLADIWGRSAAPLSGAMSGQRLVSEKLRAISRALALRLADSPDADPAMLAAVQWLARHPNGRVTELARLLGLSGRHLHRRFRSELGYGPKIFQRIVRFQRLLAAAPTDMAAVDLAASCGYADQAHMCREVREFSGAPAQSVLGRAYAALSMSDLFNTAGLQGSTVSASIRS